MLKMLPRYASIENIEFITSTLCREKRGEWKLPGLLSTSMHF